LVRDKQDGIIEEAGGKVSANKVIMQQTMGSCNKENK